MHTTSPAQELCTFTFIMKKTLFQTFELIVCMEHLWGHNFSHNPIKSTKISIHKISHIKILQDFKFLQDKNSAVTLYFCITEIIHGIFVLQKLFTDLE